MFDLTHGLIPCKVQLNMYIEKVAYKFIAITIIPKYSVCFLCISQAKLTKSADHYKLICNVRSF